MYNLLMCILFGALVAVSHAGCPGQTIQTCNNCTACQVTSGEYAYESFCSNNFWQCQTNADGTRFGVCLHCPPTLVWTGAGCDYNCPSTLPPPTTTAPPPTTTPAIPTYSSCGSHIDISLRSSSPIFLQSPGFPSNYANNLTCMWHLHAHYSNYTAVSVQSLAFNLENRYDYLQISDFYGNQYLYGNYSGSSGHINLSLNRGDYKILFHSDRSIVHQGFWLDISGTQGTPATTLAPPTTTPPPPPYTRVSCSTNYTTNNAYVYRSRGVEMQSPHFNQSNYAARTNCGWHLVNRGSSSNLIQLNLLAFDIESGYDKLYIKNSAGSTILRLSGSLTANQVNSTYTLPGSSRSYTLQFTTDGSIQKAGFDIRARLV